MFDPSFDSVNVGAHGLVDFALYLEFNIEQFKGNETFGILCENGK